MKRLWGVKEERCVMTVVIALEEEVVRIMCLVRKVAERVQRKSVFYDDLEKESKSIGLEKKDAMN